MNRWLRGSPNHCRIPSACPSGRTQTPDWSISRCSSVMSNLEPNSSEQITSMLLAGVEVNSTLLTANIQQ